MPEATAPSGVLVIDKPRGLTSFQVVARVRRICGTKRVGHAGTLDPLATGVLPLCLGPATRLIEYLSDASKEYRAVVHLGAVSPTYDAEGPITPGPAGAPLPDPIVLEATLAGFRGAQQQVPPMYSAVQQDGRRLYELARQGHEVERAPRSVTIYRLELLAYTPPEAVLLVECSKGTYIRSLAHDLGARLGCGAYLADLQRTRHGPFRLADSVGLEALAEIAAAGRLREILRPVAVLLAGLPRVDLAPQPAQRLAQGWPLDAPPPAAGGPGRLAAYGPDGQLLAVVDWDAAKACWHPTKVFAGG